MNTKLYPLETLRKKILNGLLFAALAITGTVKAQCTTTLTPTSTLICSGASITLTAGSASSYTWSDGSNTSSLVVSPAITTSYSLSTTDGSACISSASVTIVVNNTPTVSAVVSSTAVCAGKTVTMTASGANTYAWTGGVTNGASFTPSGTNSYTVTGTNACGTSSTAVSVTVFALPTVTATATSPSICAGNTVAVNGAGALTYTWLPNTVIDGVSFSPTITASYTVNGTDANGCVSVNSTTNITVINAPTVTAVVSSTGVCAGRSVTMTASGATSYTWSTGVANAASYTPAATADHTVTGVNACGTSSTVISVTVFALPSVSATASSPSVCAGSTVILNGAGANSYTWSPAVANNATFVPATTSNYTVTGTDANGCISTGTINIPVVATPTAASATGTLLCSGSSVTLTSSGAATSWLWSTGATASFVVVSPAVTTNYSVIATNAEGCSATRSLTIVVNDTPTVTAIVTSTGVCTGKTVTMTASGANTYVWNGGVTNGVSFTPASTRDYTVTGTNACGTSSTVVSVTVFALPTVTATATSPSICAGSTVALNGTGALTYTWLPNTITDGTPFSPTITLSYSVSGTDVNGCVSGNSGINIPVINTPTVTAVVNNSVVCAGKPVIMTANGAVTYTWSTGLANAASYTPVATADYTVTGVNACGTSSTIVTVTVLTLPSLTASVSNPSICSGQTISLTGTGSASGYTWNPAVPNNTAAPSITTNYSVTGTAANGCTAQVVASVTVVTTPSLSPVASSTVLCNGFSATLSAAGAAGYTWTAQNFAGSNSSSIAISPTVSTTYTIDRANSNCTTTAVVNIVVNSLPTITTSPDATVCACTTSAVISATGAVTYNWNPILATGSMVTVYPCSTTIYTVTGSNSANCISTATVAIFTNPAPSMSVTPSTPSICAGSTVGLTAAGALTYTWSSAPNASVFPGTATIVSSPTVTTLYTATGTSSFGCIGSAAFAVVVYSVTTPMASVLPAVLCVGSTATITASGSDTYSWNVNGSTAPTITVNPVASTNYSLTGYSSSGCASNLVVSVPVNTLQLSIAGNTAICQGKSTTLSGSGGTNLAWTGVSQFAVINPAPIATTVYTLTGTDANNCQLSKTFTLTVNPNPTVTASSTQTLICRGETVTLTADGATSYTWGPFANSATSATVVIAPATVFIYNYDVTGANQFGCSASSTVAVNVNACTDINEIGSSNASVNVYPNPNNGNFIIKANQGTVLTIINGLGQLVKTLTVTETNEVSIEDLSKGIYFVVGENNGLQINKKVIVN